VSIFALRLNTFIYQSCRKGPTYELPQYIAGLVAKMEVPTNIQWSAYHAIFTFLKFVGVFPYALHKDFTQIIYQKSKSGTLVSWKFWLGFRDLFFVGLHRFAITIVIFVLAFESFNFMLFVEFEVKIGTITIFWQILLEFLAVLIILAAKIKGKLILELLRDAFLLEHNISYVGKNNLSPIKMSERRVPLQRVGSDTVLEFLCTLYVIFRLFRNEKLPLDLTDVRSVDKLEFTVKIWDFLTN